MKKLKQFVFYGPGDARNNPKDIKGDNPWAYNLFRDFKSISHLGIQGLPEIRFYLNGKNSDNAISIGSTGVYEIELDGMGYITDLQFDWTQLSTLYPNPPIVPGRRLIVDFVYEGV